MTAYQTLAYISGYVGLFVAAFYVLSLAEYKRRKKTYIFDGKKTVTIIIPAWNEESCIETTIESALKLDYPKGKLEIFVVDDGSKDKTYELAKKYENSKTHKVRVFTKPNGGKGSALNHGIERSKNDIIISMDADTIVDKDAVKLMVARFYSEEVMAVTPAMGIYQPKSILQRIQQIEYYLGTFLRKIFSILNAVHVTPGAFSAYRRKFFLKHGGYREDDVTEDLEVALRLQKYGYIIENVPEAIVQTLGPSKFKQLLFQRRRWYSGQIRNFWRYRELFGFKTGVLGTIVLPMAIISILFSMTLTVYSLVKIVIELRKEIIFLNSVNFQFNGVFEFSNYFTSEFFSKFFFSTLSKPIFLFAVLFIVISIFYLSFARRRFKFRGFMVPNFILFILGFSLLYTFWWIVSIFASVANKRVEWRKADVKKT